MGLGGGIANERQRGVHRPEVRQRKRSRVAYSEKELAAISLTLCFPHTTQFPPEKPTSDVIRFSKIEPKEPSIPFFCPPATRGSRDCTDSLYRREFVNTLRLGSAATAASPLGPECASVVRNVGFILRNPGAPVTGSCVAGPRMVYGAQNGAKSHGREGTFI